MSASEYSMPLSAAKVKELKKLNNILSITRRLDPEGMYGDVFPI